MKHKKKVPTIKVSDKCVSCPYFALTFDSDDDIVGTGHCHKFPAKWDWPRYTGEDNFLDLSDIDPKYHRQVIECYRCMTSENPDANFLPLDEDEDLTEVIYVVRNKGGQGIYQTIYDGYIQVWEQLISHS
jgi:hypothetical protein